MVFEELARGILDFVNYGITILVIMILIEAFRFVFHETDIGRRMDQGDVVGMIKDFGRNRAEKTKRKAKRAFALEMGEFVREKNELELMERAKKHVDRIVAEKAHLEGLSGTDPHAQDQFEAFTGAIKAVIDDELEPELSQWRGVKRTTFKTQQRLNDMIKELEKNEDIPAERINELKAEEGKILKVHQETEKEIEKLLDLLEGMREAAERAHGTIRMITTGTHGPYGVSGGVGFDLGEAQKELRAFNFSAAPAIAADLVRKQGDVVTILTDIVRRTKGLM